jgi:hypothetical protein
MPRQYTRGTPETRFWTHVDRSGDCWLWTGSRSHNGYGQFTIRVGKVVRAHRWIREQIHGPIPPGLQVLHHCDIRHCVRDEHTYVGTPADNSRDMMARGRGKGQFTP